MSTFSDRASKALDSPAGRRIAGLVRLAVLAAIGAFIFSRLADLGFDAVLAAAPRNPFYYVLLAAAYFALPISETLIYERLWRAKRQRLFPALLRKKVLNDGVLGYSGEAYFGIWAHRALGLSKSDVFAGLKDVNFISSFASLTTTLLMTVIVLIAIGGEAGETRAQLLLFVLIGGALAIGAFLLRRFALSARVGEAGAIASVHFTRLGVVIALQVAQWALVIPSVPLMNWFFVATAAMLARRVPFLPSYDLILVGLGLSMTGVIGAAPEAVAGLFLAGAAATQMLNLIVILGTAGVSAARR